MPPSKHLWAIDNDPIYQFTLKKTLQMMGGFGKLHTFDNGKAALTKLQKQSSDPAKLPDIILLDINMPVMDGWTFIREFDALAVDLAKNIDLYLLTSSIDDEDRERALSYASVTGYRVKPLSHCQLEELINELALTRT